MSFKRLILITVFTIATIPILSAQRSASATMKVSVNIVEGAKVEVQADRQPLNLVSLNEGIIELAKIKLQSADGNNINVERAKVLDLKSSEGGHIHFKLLEDKNEADLNFSYKAVTGSESSTSKLKEGKYQGSLTTRIEYI